MILRNKGSQTASWEWMSGRAEGMMAVRWNVGSWESFIPGACWEANGAPSAGDWPRTSQAFSEEASLSKVIQMLNTRQRHSRLSDFRVCTLRVTPRSWLEVEIVSWGRALKRSPQSSLLFPVWNHRNVQNKNVFYSIPQLISSHVGNEWFLLSLEIEQFGNIWATKNVLF